MFFDIGYISLVILPQFNKNFKGCFNNFTNCSHLIKINRFKFCKSFVIISDSKKVILGGCMAAFEYILFDLDGTISDSAEGITNSVMYAEQKMGYPVSSREELFKFVGPPLHESFEKHLGLDREGGLYAVECYREYYNVKGIFENKIYDGIEDVLSTLKANGKTVLLATSKPEVYAVQILEHFHLAKYFDYICGATLQGRTDKAEVIEYALQTAKIADKSRCLMIGDRMHDILGAKKVGLAALGVLFGYGSHEELENAGADFIAETPKDILKHALK